MEAAWGNLIATASGAVIAVFSVWLTNAGHTQRLKTQLDNEREKSARELRRTSAENLYELVDSWQRNLAHYHLLQWHVFAGKLTPDQADESYSNSDRVNVSNLGRIEMLIKAYFPSVQPAYSAALAARDDINVVITEFGRQYKATGKRPKECFDTLELRQTAYDAAAENLNTAIINEIRTSTLVP